MCSAGLQSRRNKTRRARWNLALAWARRRSNTNCTQCYFHIAINIFIHVGLFLFLEHLQRRGKKGRLSSKWSLALAFTARSRKHFPALCFSLNSSDCNCNDINLKAHCFFVFSAIAIEEEQNTLSPMELGAAEQLKLYAN